MKSVEKKNDAVLDDSVNQMFQEHKKQDGKKH